MRFEEEDIYTPAMHRVQRLQSLQPMASGQVLDLTTKAFRAMGMRILRPTFSAATLVYIAFMMMTQLILPQLWTTKVPNDIYGQVAEVATTIVLGICTALPIVVIGLAIVITHAVHATADFVSDRTVHESERGTRSDADLWKAMKLITRTLLTACSGLLATLALLLGSAILSDRFQDFSAAAGGLAILAAFVSVAVFIYVAVRHSLAPAAVLLEGVSIRHASKRSVQLLRGYKGAGAGDDTIIALGSLLVIIGLCFWGGVSGIYSILGVIPWLNGAVGRFWWGEIAITLVAGLPYLFAFWIMAPIISVGTTLVYFERRIRLEGYDISLLHKELSPKR